MDEDALVRVLSGVVMMGGDRLSDLLATSEIRALAEAVATCWAREMQAAPQPVPVVSGLDFLSRDASYPLVGFN